MPGTDFDRPQWRCPGPVAPAARDPTECRCAGTSAAAPRRVARESTGAAGTHRREAAGKGRIGPGARARLGPLRFEERLIMTAKKLALLHTSAVLAPLFASLCAKWMPEARIFHMVDESLIKNTIQAGHLQKLTIRRLIAMIESGFDAGADAMLVTCSSIGPGVGVAQMLCDLPVIRVDEAMAQAAALQAKRSGVVATLRTTR